MPLLSCKKHFKEEQACFIATMKRDANNNTHSKVII